MQDQKWLDDWKTNQTFSDVATMNKKVFKEVLPQYPGCQMKMGPNHTGNFYVVEALNQFGKRVAQVSFPMK